MQWVWGNYIHVADEVDLVNFTQQSEPNEGGQQMVNHVGMTLKGFIQAADQDSLTTAMNQLANVYAHPFQENRVFQGTLLSNSGAVSAHVIGGPGSRNGVRCSNFQWLKEAPGEYSTYRSYQITLEAEYDVLNVELESFYESLQFIGTGGPLIVHLPCLQHPVQRQEAQKFTVCRAIQTGVIVGHLRYVEPPGPLWPGDEQVQLRDRKPKSPRRSGPVGYPFLSGFEIAYTYHFEGPNPFFGLPNVWQ